MQSADPLLVVGLTILLFVMLIINIYILAYWQHPDDKNESYLARLLIVYGLQLCAVSVLMIPVDVANDEGNPYCDTNSSLHGTNNDYCGGINMFKVWEVFFCMLCFSVVVFIPFATFYYESDSVSIRDSTIKTSRFWPAFWQEVVVITFFAIVLLALYFTKSYAELPIKEYDIPFEEVFLFNYSRSEGGTPYTFLERTIPIHSPINITSSETHILLPLNFAVYCIGLFAWIAWWAFALFAGVGLACTPFDYITAYIWRPHVLAPDDLANKELELQEKTAELLELVTLLKRERTNLNDGTGKAKRAIRLRYMTDRLEVNKLTQMVFLLERDLEQLNACKVARHGYNPLKPYAYLIAGVIFSILTLVWLLQIILAMLTNPPATPFLSLYLVAFDSWFPMFGNLTYAIFALYLLLCTMKGAFKLSVRFLCCKLHPMQVGGTYINSFLFNLGIIMTCAIPLVHFCVLAFQGYSVNTDVFFLFSVQVNNINFFMVFFRNNVFVWMLMLIAFLMLLYLFIRPRDVATSTEDFRRGLYSRSQVADNAYDALGTKEAEMTKV